MKLKQKDASKLNEGITRLLIQPYYKFLAYYKEYIEAG